MRKVVGTAVIVGASLSLAQPLAHEAGLVPQSVSVHDVLFPPAHASSVEERVKKVVAEQLNVREVEVKNEASFVEDLGADSLDTVELTMALEQEFNIEIPDEEAENMKTVQNAIDYVNKHAQP